MTIPLLWLETHPWLDALPALGAASLLLWRAATAPVAPLNRSIRSWSVFPLLLLATLVLWRWPQLLDPHELNPDESQFIAGAQTLRHDPVFWRAVDGMTSGPLITYALVPLTWVGLKLSFLSARAVGLLAIWLTFAAAFWHIAEHYQRRAASLGIIAAALFFAVNVDPDFNHYSSEQVPIALLALSAWLMLRPAGSRAGVWREMLGAGLAGLTPWAKLQAAPLGVCLVLFAFVRLWLDDSASPRDRLRRLSALITGGLLPSALIFGAISFTGLWPDFYRSYLVQNLLYAHPAKLSVFASTSRYLKTDASILGYATVILASIAVLALAILRRRRLGRDPFRVAIYFAPLWLLAAIVCVLAPGRDYLHYSFLLLPPVLMIAGCAFGELTCRAEESKRRAPIATTIVFAACGAIAVLRLANPLPHFSRALADYDRHTPSQLGSIAGLLCKSDPTLAVWGWSHEVYVETGARQGTRSAYTYWEIVNHPQRQYFRDRFVADFAARRPAVFIDAVGNNTFPFRDRALNAHETLPALATLVDRDYCLVAELGYSRVYARRDHLAATKISQTQIRQAELTGIAPAESPQVETEDLNQFSPPKDTLNGTFVMMMRPPASVRLPLRGTERELELGYGYSPRAMRETSGNGTEFTAVLSAPGEAPRILSRFLFDPAHQPDQQTAQTLRLLLPPGLSPGSVLTLSTSPGPYGNDAWDWFYLNRIGFVRAPGLLPKQFPGFNRPPDFIRAPQSTLTSKGRNVVLKLDAPVLLGFQLKGHERTLEFTYGLRSGVEITTRSTGAIFRVVAASLGCAPRILFERRLDPAHTAKDRGEQSAAIDLPALPLETQLSIEIDPDGSNAWDSTYITTLRLG